MSSIRALVLGNSHIECLRSAVRAESRLGDELRIERLGSGGSSGWIDGKAALALARNLPETALVFLLKPGATHNQIALYDPAEDFDVVLPGEGLAKDDAQPAIPVNMMSDWLRRENFEKSFASMLYEIVGSRLYIISIPPPKQSREFLHDRISRSTIAAQRNGQVRQPPVARADLRLAIWNLEQSVVKGWCLDRGVTFVPPPARTINGDGFLGRAYYNPDVTHANADYGAEVLGQVHRILSKRNKD